MTEPATESAAGPAPPEPNFESVERELEAITARLEGPQVALEERLRLHAGATAKLRQLEAILETARETIGRAVAEAAPVDPPEPYEAVRDRLARTVDLLEGDDVSLADTVRLHAEARRLAARCDSILAAAEEQIAESPGSPEAEPSLPSPEPGAGAEDEPPF